MRVVLLAMLLGCALAASVHEKVKRAADEHADRNSDLSQGNREWRNEGKHRKAVANAESKEGGEGSLKRVRRDIDPCSKVYLWPENNFCYYFDDHFTEDQYATLKSHIETVFNDYKSLSCVTFTEVASADSACPAINVKPAKIMADNKGCWSHIGCSASTSTSVSLPNDCKQLGVIYHEVFHALGRQHEQTRQDRENFVTVIEANIKPEKLYNYNMCSRELYNLDYDYQSIMHYGAYSFRCENCGDTMLVDEKHSHQQTKMGKQQKLSPTDIATLNKMYSCYDDLTIEPMKKCDNGGVLLSGGTCHCYKPFTGNKCEIVDVKLEHQFKNAGSEELTVASPNYPKKYPLNVDFVYYCKCTTAGTKVKLHFDTFAIEDWGCGYDKVEFRGAKEIYPNIVCGDLLKGKDFLAEDDNLIIEFISDDAYTYSGFSAVFTCV